MFLTAGEKDERVHALHAHKMTALLQASTASDPAQEPILLQVEREAGHGMGAPIDMQLRGLVDEMSFFRWQLGMGKPCGRLYSSCSTSRSITSSKSRSAGSL